MIAQFFRSNCLCGSNFRRSVAADIWSIFDRIFRAAIDFSRFSGPVLYVCASCACACMCVLFSKTKFLSQKFHLIIFFKFWKNMIEYFQNLKNLVENFENFDLIKFSSGGGQSCRNLQKTGHKADQCVLKFSIKLKFKRSLCIILKVKFSLYF